MGQPPGFHLRPRDPNLHLHFSLKSSSKGRHDPIDSLENIPTSSVSTFENPFILNVFYGFLWHHKIADQHSCPKQRQTVLNSGELLSGRIGTLCMPFLRRSKFGPPKNRMKTSVPVYRLEDFDNLFHPSSQFHDKVSICQQITFGQISPIIHYLFWILYLTGPQLNFSLDTFAAFTYVAYLENRGDRNKGDSSKSGPERMLIRCSWILKGFRHT